MLYDETNSLVTIYAVSADNADTFIRKNRDVTIIKETETTVYGYKVYDNGMSKYAVTAEDVEFLLNFNKSTEWTLEGLVQ